MYPVYPAGFEGASADVRADGRPRPSARNRIEGITARVATRRDRESKAGEETHQVRPGRRGSRRDTGFPLSRPWPSGGLRLRQSASDSAVRVSESASFGNSAPLLFSGAIRHFGCSRGGVGARGVAARGRDLNKFRDCLLEAKPGSHDSQSAITRPGAQLSIRKRARWTERDRARKQFISPCPSPSVRNATDSPSATLLDSGRARVLPPLTRRLTLPEPRESNTRPP